MALVMDAPAPSFDPRRVSRGRGRRPGRPAAAAPGSMAGRSGRSLGRGPRRWPAAARRWGCTGSSLDPTGVGVGRGPAPRRVAMRRLQLLVGLVAVQVAAGGTPVGVERLVMQGAPILGS